MGAAHQRRPKPVGASTSTQAAPSTKKIRSNEARPRSLWSLLRYCCVCCGATISLAIVGALCFWLIAVARISHNVDMLKRDGGFLEEPWRTMGTSWSQITSDSSAFVNPAFVTDDDAEHLRELLVPIAEAAGTTGPKDRPYKGYKNHVLTAEDRRDPVVVRLERRVAELTGVPASRNDMLSFIISTPYQKNHGTLHNVHHDRNRSPGRVATVLIHLAGGGDEDGDHIGGGETIFPCARSGGDEHDSKSPMCHGLRELYEHGKFNIYMPANQDALRRLPPGRARDQMITWSKEMENMCSASLSEDEASREAGRRSDQAEPLRFWPRKGAAMLFLSHAPTNASCGGAGGGSGERVMRLESRPLMWHGGCRVRSGKKLLLTIFKELPAPVVSELSSHYNVCVRPPPAWWSPLGVARAIAPLVVRLIGTY